MSQIFISYQRNSYNFVAEDLTKRLEKEGFTLWWDERINAGTADWRKKIDTEIENSRVILLVVTPDAMSSQYVTYEWSYALGKNKIVLPITYFKAKLHPRLSTTQILDFTDSRSRQWPDLMTSLHTYLDGDKSSGDDELIPKDGILNALADLLCAKRLSQADLNIFVAQELITPMDLAEIRRRSMSQEAS